MTREEVTHAVDRWNSFLKRYFATLVYDNYYFLFRLNKSLYRLCTLPTATVAAVNGHAIAGGAIFALANDLRVARSGMEPSGIFYCGTLQLPH